MKTASDIHLDALGADLDLLTAENRESIDTNGFLVASKVIDPQWREDLRRRFGEIPQEEGERAASEHHKEAGAPRLANLVNKGAIFEKVWAHPLLLAACRYIFGGEFKISSLNGREAIEDGGRISSNLQRAYVAGRVREYGRDEATPAPQLLHTERRPPAAGPEEMDQAGDTLPDYAGAEVAARRVALR